MVARSPLPRLNSPLSQEHAEELGGHKLSPKETNFALELHKSLPEGGAGSLDLTQVIQPLRPIDPNAPSASTDVGDVSWTVPTIGFVAATFVPGVAPHTWQATATAGLTIGQNRMLLAPKALAITASAPLPDPNFVTSCHDTF